MMKTETRVELHVLRADLRAWRTSSHEIGRVLYFVQTLHTTTAMIDDARNHR